MRDPVQPLSRRSLHHIASSHVLTDVGAGGSISMSTIIMFSGDVDARDAMMIPVAAGYSGTPLPTKLGIKEGHRVAILGNALSLALPTGATVATKLSGSKPFDVIVYFVFTRKDFEAKLETLRARMT